MKYRANAKLLLSGEYLVLKGATALSVPTIYGQELEVKDQINDGIQISSFDQDNHQWFGAQFNLDLSILSYTSEKEAKTLQNILKIALEMGAVLKSQELKFSLDFDRNWGLGTSSTLIDLIAQHYKLDPFLLFFKSLSGSGYDVAQARENQAILYQLNNQKPIINKVRISKAWQDGYFIYLGQKQNSEKEVKKFSELSISKEAIDEISIITNSLANCNSKTDIIQLLAEHEEIISSVLGRESLHSKHTDFKGTVKSLGAWGGDFAFAIGSSTREYFSSKGYKTIIPFIDMVYPDSN